MIFNELTLNEINNPKNMTFDEDEFSDDWAKKIKRYLTLAEMSEKEVRKELLKNAIACYWRYVQILKDNPCDYFRVYSVCKGIDEIAELEGVDFKGASLKEKINTVKELINFVDPKVIVKGVREFHESSWCKGDTA